MLSILIMYAINASTFCFKKLLLESWSPFWLASINTLLSGVLLLAYEYFCQYKQGPITKKLLSRLLPASLCIMYGAALLRMYALSYISPSIVAFFGALDPFIAASLAYLIKKEKLTGLQMIGILLATVGALPLLAAHNPGITTGLNISQFLSLPALAGLASVVVNRYGWILMHERIHEKDSLNSSMYSMGFLTALMMFMGGTVSLGTAAIFERLSFASFSWMSFALFIYLLITNSICCTMYASQVNKYGVTLLTLTEFFNPLFAAFYAWLFLKEPITAKFILSSMVVLGGLFAFSYTELAKHFKHQKRSV